MQNATHKFLNIFGFGVAVFSLSKPASNCMFLQAVLHSIEMLYVVGGVGECVM
jgi:hypothetical protein